MHPTLPTSFPSPLPTYFRGRDDQDKGSIPGRKKRDWHNISPQESMFKCIRHYQHPPPPPFPHLSNVEIADGIRGNSMSHVFISTATQKIEHICVDQRRTISHGVLLSTLELGGRGSGRLTLSWQVSEWIPLFSPGDGPLKVMHPNKFDTILENMWFLNCRTTSCGNFWNTYSYKGKECIFYEIQCHLSNYHQSVQKSTDPGTDPL